MRFALVAIALCGCGRIGFDSVGGDDTSIACDVTPCAGVATMSICGGVCWTSCAEAVEQGAAAARCVAWGGELARIEDEQENACADDVRGVDEPWIGLVQSAGAVAKDADWHWTTRPAPAAFIKWNLGQPNDGEDMSPEIGTAQCAFMQDNGTWNDEECVLELSFVCRR